MIFLTGNQTVQTVVNRSGKNIIAAFTFLELMVVISIMSFLLLLSYPSFSRSAQSFKIDNTAVKVMRLFQMSRESSILNSCIYRVCFEARKKYFYVERYIDTDSDFIRVNKIQSMHLPDGFDATSEPKVVSFYPDGHSAGALISLIYKNDKREFVLDGLNGFIFKKQ